MADLLNDKEKVMETIMTKTKKGKGEIEELITQKKNKFAGLLTDTGAAFMVAKDLGVELRLDKAISETLKVAQLEDGMNNVDLVVTVKQIFAPKTFEKGGKRGVLCNLIVADDSGETRLTVWHKDVKRLSELKLERGDQILLKNCYVTAFQEKPQLNLGFNGQLILDKKGERKIVKLKALQKDLSDVDIIGRIIRIFPRKIFEREQGKGKVLNFEITDDTAKIRATAWNDLVPVVENRAPGDVVKIEGAYTKEGLQGLELHLGFRSRLLLEPEIDFFIPPVESFAPKPEQVKVSDLKDGDSFKELKGVIVSLPRAPGQYKVCPECRRKVQEIEKQFVCDACGQVKPETNLVVSFELDDGSSVIRCVCFGPQAERLLDMEKADVSSRLQASEEIFLKELKAKLVGKQVTLAGQARRNPLSENLEFMVRQIIKLGAPEK